MSDELSTSSEYDGVASRTLLPGAQENVRPVLCGCVKASKLAPYTDDGLHLASFDIDSIERHHGTPNEPSRLSGYDGVALWFHLLPVGETSPRGARNRRNQPYT